MVMAKLVAYAEDSGARVKTHKDQSATPRKGVGTAEEQTLLRSRSP